MTAAAGSRAAAGGVLPTGVAHTTILRVLGVTTTIPRVLGVTTTIPWVLGVTTTIPRVLGVTTTIPRVLGVTTTIPRVPQGRTCPRQQTLLPCMCACLPPALQDVQGALVHEVTARRHAVDAYSATVQEK